MTLRGSALNQIMASAEINSDLLAAQISAGENEVLPIYAADNAIRGMLNDLILSGEHSHRPWQIELVDEADKDKAFIGLSLSKDHFVSVEILDKECRSFGISHLVRTLEVTPGQRNDHNLTGFLEAVACFRRHLKREEYQPVIEGAIKVAFFKLVPTGRLLPDFTREYIPKMETAGMPEGDRYIVNLNHDKKVELTIKDGSGNGGEVKTKERYGLTIRNSSKVGLYASVFFFSLSNFEICELYITIPVCFELIYSLPIDVPSSILRTTIQ
jgi:hypothetical protein